MLVGGPKYMPLMLEQSGVRYATIFTSEKALKRFRDSRRIAKSSKLRLRTASR
jgi:hypothetical protein